jgi:hypothetical protein
MGISGVGIMRRIAILIVASFFASNLLTTSLQARHPPSEAELLSRIQREHNPVKKAKLEVRLANLKLEQAIAAYNRQELDEGAGLLNVYLSEVKQAWQTLEATGHDPVKKPQGFMDLEISLREDLRKLTEARRSTFYTNRGPIDAVRSQVSNLHAKVLSALFPGVDGNASNPKSLSSLTAAPGKVHP